MPRVGRTSHFVLGNLCGNGGIFLSATLGVWVQHCSNRHTGTYTHTESAVGIISQLCPGGDIQIIQKYQLLQPCPGIRAGCGTDFSLHFQTLITEGTGSSPISTALTALTIKNKKAIIHIVNNNHNSPAMLH